MQATNEETSYPLRERDDKRQAKIVGSDEKKVYALLRLLPFDLIQYSVVPKSGCVKLEMESEEFKGMQMVEYGFGKEKHVGELVLLGKKVELDAYILKEKLTLSACEANDNKENELNEKNNPPSKYGFLLHWHFNIYLINIILNRT